MKLASPLALYDWPRVRSLIETPIAAPCCATYCASSGESAARLPSLGARVGARSTAGVRGWLVAVGFAWRAALVDAREGAITASVITSAIMRAASAPRIPHR